MNKQHGFTLIELLIVVAIIAILAAIAVPNFLEAQTRSKVSRVKSDMRSVATALESFRVDRQFYPPDGRWQVVGAAQDFVTAKVGFNPPASSTGVNYWRLDNIFWLTTPIAYIATLPTDPFTSTEGWWVGSYLYENYFNLAKEQNIPNSIQTISINDIERVDNHTVAEWLVESLGPDRIKDVPFSFITYDPTNGTVSAGDIFRAGP
jgi:prepilin-type N-terminal cleavage/methylation domain-containing protein